MLAKIGPDNLLFAFYSLLRFKTSTRQLNAEIDVSYRSLRQRIERSGELLDAPAIPLVSLVDINEFYVSAGRKGCERNHNIFYISGDDAYEELVVPDLADYVSPLFEWSCQHALPELPDRQFQDTGQCWFKRHELGVLGLTHDGLVAGEYRFTSQLVSQEVFAGLKRTALEVR